MKADNIKISGFVILFCFFLGIPAPEGQSIICRSCDNAINAHDCRVFEHCKADHYCMTEVYELNSVYTFTYSCKAHHECEGAINLVGKRAAGHHNLGTLVCKQCCDTTLCDTHTCHVHVAEVQNEVLNSKRKSEGRIPATEEKRFQTTPTNTTTQKPITTMPTTTAAVVIDPNCRDFESETFKCAELDIYNFCTDTTSVAYAIAHEKCAKHCGFCVATTVKATLEPVTTAAPIITTDIQTPEPMTTTEPTSMFTTITSTIIDINVTQSFITTTEICADINDPTLTCADMQRFGFCDPASGAGYTFAQLRCRKTCGFCV